MTRDSGVALPRVLYAADLDPATKFGTFEDQVFALCRAFEARGGRFLPLYRAPLGPRARLDYERVGLSAESLDLTRFRAVTFWRLLRLVRRNQIDVVHWNFYEPLKNPYLWALGLLAPGVSHYFTDHISRPTDEEAAAKENSTRDALKRWLYQRYARVFCVSDYVARRLQSGARWPNVRRWNHLVSTARFCPDAAARQETRDRFDGGGRFVVLTVAQLTEQKGVDVAIRALGMLPPSAVLWVVGEGPKRLELEALARGLGLDSRVRFFGAQWDVSPLMRAADALVCPSRWAEAAGLVLIEAAATGLPIVASRIGGIPEYVDDQITGALVTPGDVEELARSLRHLQDDPVARATLGGAGRASALARFSLEARIDDYLACYTPDSPQPQLSPAPLGAL